MITLLLRYRWFRYSALAGLLVLVCLGLYLLRRIHHAGSSGLNPGVAALPREDREQIVVDPRHHAIIIKRKSGGTVTHLPDRPTVIDIREDGTTTVTAQQWGLELRPFVGLGVTTDAMVGVGLGVDGFYWKCLDLGGGLMLNMRGRDPRVFVALSYNVKDNLRFSATVDHTKAVGAMLSIRL